MSITFEGLTEKEDARLRDHAKNELAQNHLYNPQEASNFWEAIDKADEARRARAHALLESGEFVAAAAAMKLIAYDYWFEYVAAISREEIIDQLATEEFDLQAH